MALGPATAPGTSTRTQKFGPPTPSTPGYYSQPEMYAAGDQVAYWQPYKGWPRFAHYHNGLDEAAAAGTPLLAMETGKVVRSGFDSSFGGGYVIEVEIRRGTRFGFAHCQGPPAPVGKIVKKGETIARVGSTGVATGNHCHVTLEIEEIGSDGVLRTLLWNPLLWMSGGAYANDPRIRPAYAAELPDTSTRVTIHSELVCRGAPNIRATPGGTIVGTAKAGQTFIGRHLEKSGAAYTDPWTGKTRHDWVEVEHFGKLRWIAKAFLTTTRDFLAPSSTRRAIHSELRCLGAPYIRATPGGVVVGTAAKGQLFIGRWHETSGPTYVSPWDGTTRRDWVGVELSGRIRWIAKAFLKTVRAL